MNLWEAKQAAFEKTVRTLDTQGWSGTVPLAVADLTPELSEWYAGTTEKLQVNFMQFLGQMRDASYDGLAADDMCVRFRDMCDAPRSRLKWPPDCEATLKTLSLARTRRLCGFDSVLKAVVGPEWGDNLEDIPGTESSDVVAILNLQRAHALFDLIQEARELLPGVSFRAKATAGESRVELYLLWPGSKEDMACALDCLDDMLHEWRPDPGSWLTLCSEFT